MIRIAEPAECLVCQESFPRPSRRHKYCSRRCRLISANRAWRARRKAARLSSCAQCGKELAGTRRKYCSVRCGEIAHGKRRAEPLPPRNCAVPECGIQFVPTYDRQRCCCEKHGKLLYNRESRADGRQKAEPWSDKRRDRYHRRKALKKGAATGRPVRLADIAERDRWRCGICRRTVSKKLQWPHPRSASLDHIIPLTEDGAMHDPAYVRLAHLACNTARGNRGGNEQLALALDVA